MSARKGDWKNYEPGLILGAAEVLGVEVDGGTQASTLYRVRYTCCGREDVISHVSIVKRIGNNSKRCGQCWSGPNAKPPPQGTEAAAEKVAGWRLYRDADIEGVRCATGFWPRLGPLGFRSSCGGGGIEDSGIRRAPGRHFTGKIVS